MPGVIKYITVKDIPKGGVNNFMPTSFGLAEEEVMCRLVICLFTLVSVVVGYLQWLSNSRVKQKGIILSTDTLAI